MKEKAGFLHPVIRGIWSIYKTNDRSKKRLLWYNNKMQHGRNLRLTTLCME